MKYVSKIKTLQSLLQSPHVRDFLPHEIATIFLSLSPFVSDLLVFDSWVSSSCAGMKRERVPLHKLATTESIDKVIPKERGVKRNETRVARPSATSTEHSEVPITHKYQK